MSIRIPFRRITRVFLLAGAFALLTGLAYAEPDKEALRERFKTGLTHYEAGQVDDALAIWRPIYEELGPVEGYRLAFNIARAEEGRSDLRAAAKWYAAYLTAVDARRARGEPIEAGILGQEIDARDRLAALSRELVRIETSAPGALLRLDSEPEVPTPATLYALPGRHTLRLVRAAKILDVKSDEFKRGDVVVLEEPPPPRAPLHSPMVNEQVRPYSAAVPLTVLGLAAASAFVTTAGYVRANSLFDSYSFASADARPDIADSYSSARTLSYVSLAVTLVLTAASAGLGAFYWFGVTERKEPRASR